ncbi:hypothetical protein ARMSODRAFT_404731 [Armillaria solidipes]|uniref:Telomerase reverse transcriptase n=1 Tax=Armillaria solidipes TaxID=1076256 RepID=A0A2H3CHW5_9AGAR|nr:hypothetical protein ARMSODRAFT_404731 [Armillaria solidipes]
MMHLLTEAAIFLSLPNNCFCQMTGEPLINLPPPRLPMDPGISSLGKRSTKLPSLDERPTKLQRTDSSYGSRQWNDPNATMKTVVASPADVTICRSRLFFARLATIPHTNQILCGFQPNHILNRLMPSYPIVGQLNGDEVPDYDPRQQQEKARHLSKYIFPRQYGLSSAFTFKTSKWGPATTPTFTDRGAEIRPSKTPKRLKETLNRLDTLIWRHGKCKYKLLRDQVCPSKVATKSEKPLESSMILELLSEETSQLQSQASVGEVSLDSAGNSVFPIGLTQARRYAESKPRFVEFSCSHFEVGD